MKELKLFETEVFKWTDKAKQISSLKTFSFSVQDFPKTVSLSIIWSQFVHTMFIARLRSNMSMDSAVIIDY